MAKTSTPARASLAVAAVCLAVTGCASSSEMRALRQPAMPPAMVAKAVPGREYYRNIALQDVQGAPEFR